MNQTLVNPKKMKNLDDYAFALVSGMITLKTLMEFQAQSMKLGILKEDQECRVNTILWDFNRISKLYQEQCASVLEMLPENFSFESIIEDLQKIHVEQAKKLAKGVKSGIKSKK
jgi:hypothetical protein